MRNFSNALREAMAKSGLSEADVSEAFDASIPTVRRWLRGTRKPVPTVQALVLQWFNSMMPARGLDTRDDSMTALQQHPNAIGKFLSVEETEWPNECTCHWAADWDADFSDDPTCRLGPEGHGTRKLRLAHIVLFPTAGQRTLLMHGAEALFELPVDADIQDKTAWIGKDAFINAHGFVTCEPT